MAYKMDRYMEDLVVKLIGVHSLHHFQLVPMLEWCYNHSNHIYSRFP